MKLKEIEAYVENNKSKGRKYIYVHDPESEEDNIWIQIVIASDKDSAHIVDTDFWNIRELGDFGKALYQIRQKVVA